MGTREGQYTERDSGTREIVKTKETVETSGIVDGVNTKETN